MNVKYVTPDEIENVDCVLNEQETTVTFMRTDEMISVYTSDATMLTKLKKTFANNPEEITCREAGRTSDGGVTGYFFEMPKKYFTIKKSTKFSDRQVSEEQKQAASARFKKMWANRKNEN